THCLRPSPMFRMLWRPWLNCTRTRVVSFRRASLCRIREKGRIMAARIPTIVGHRLLNRRDFLNYASTGLGSLALASLLQRDALLAGGEGPIRPTIRPEAPLAPRPPHTRARANRVLMIFCSGAVSHVD